jgi:hypothetical protein
LVMVQIALSFGDPGWLGRAGAGSV